MAEWFNKFKVGQEVKVVKKVGDWRYGGYGGAIWVSEMDKTMGKVCKIVDIDTGIGFQLNTQIGGYDYWYPTESLEEVNVRGRQLLFNFMKEEN